MMHNSTSDEKLAQMANGGDESALNELINRHYLMMYQVAYHKCGRREDALDIVQDACERIYVYIDRFEGKSSFKTWAYRITANAAYKHFNKNMAPRWQERPIEDYRDAAAIASQEQHTTAQEVLTRLSTMPDKLTDAVKLVFYDGLNHAEAAKILGVSESTISWRIHTVRRKMERFIQQLIRACAVVL